jgi:hypothetical protein
MLLTHLFENKHMTEADIASVNWNTDSDQDSLNEFAPGSSGDGSSPYAYGMALKEMAKLYAEGEFDLDDVSGMDTASQNQSDAEEINSVADAFMNRGMEAGREAYSMVDTMVQEDMDEYLDGQGFNVDADIHAEYQKDVDRYNDSPEGQADKDQQAQRDAEWEEDLPTWRAAQVEIAAVNPKNQSSVLHSVQFDARKYNSSVGQLKSTLEQQLNKIKQSTLGSVIRITLGGKPTDIQGILDQFDQLSKKPGVTEGGEKDRQWSNKDMEKLRVATRDFDDMLSADGPDAFKQELIKKRIKTKPMAGPKGQLPEQGMAEDSENAFAPVKLHDQQSNTYGDAILDIADQFEDKFSDDDAGQYATAIATVGHAFLNNGMRSGRAKLFGLEQAVYKHVLMSLDQQGLDIVKDIIRPHFKPDNKVPFKNKDTADTVSESVQIKQKRHHFIYEADSDFEDRFAAHQLDMYRRMNPSSDPKKMQAFLDQQAQIKAAVAARNAEHVKQREEEYQARLKRDKEAQEKQDARTKPGNDNNARPPHGGPDGELKMFMSGAKPAATVEEPELSKWRNLIDSGKYAIKQLFGEKGEPNGIVIGQPGEEDRVGKIASLIQNASDLGHKGDFSAYHNSNYHRWLGRLLGYPADKIEKFIADYFADGTKDLAKGRFDEGDISQLEKDIAAAPVEPIANMEATEKVGNMDADSFDAAMARLKKLAGAGPLKTVWDPKKRVYKNVPTAVQPKK